jgi:formiminoglutamate deiminase
VIWCEQAWLGGPGVEAAVAIEIEDGVITEVRPGAEPAGERVPGLTLPGLANAHSHAFQRVLRGRTQRGRGSFWTWREAMYEAAAALEPDGYRELAAGVFAEMVRAGITLVGEFHYLHHGPDGTPYADPNAMGAAVIDAAAATGIRLTLLDTCYLHGGIGAGLEGVQRRFGDGSVDLWAERVAALADGPRVRIGAAAHSVRALAPEELAAVAAATGGRPLHAHVSEQPRENEECLAAYGRTPGQVLADAGCLDRDFTAVHATHATEPLPRVCLCPTTERDLADGVGRPTGPFALGSDSNAVIDLFEEARAVELDQRLVTGVRGHHEPEALLAGATATGYAALGWDGGALRPGACADLVAIGLDSVRLAGAEDLVGSVVYAAHPADVRRVMVGGEWIL